MYRHLLVVVASVLFAAKAAGGVLGLKASVAAPVEIVTTGDKKATAEILVEITWTNTFDRNVKWRTSDVPQFAIFDAAGNYVDTFVVDTKPQEGEKQITPDKEEVTLEPKKSYSWKVKVWVRGLAMEPGRCYMLGDTHNELDEKVPFVPEVKDGRGKLRPTLYEQTVRMKAGKIELCATVFDVDEKKGVAYALTILEEAAETVEVTPLYYRTGPSDNVTSLYGGKAVKGSVRRAKSGVAVVEFPLKTSEFLTLKPRFLPLAKVDYAYSKGTYIACGWSPAVGVTAPCSAIRGGIVNGFSTYYATPREGWRGSGYYSDSGYLVGLCDMGPNPEGHSNRLGSYVGLKKLHEDLKEIKYEFTPGYGKKEEK